MVVKKAPAAKRKTRETLKVVPPVSSLEASIPDHVQRRAAKIHIGLEIENVGDGEPYIALDENEFDSFSDSWCSQCKHGNNEQKPCSIREGGAISGNELPEWLWYKNKPLCKAFEYEIETVDHNWQPHVSSIAYSAPSVNYEPMAYCSNNGLNELVINSMMSHWCHSCAKKDTCAGFRNVVADKDDLPSYWLWVDKHPVCTEFSPKEIVVQVAAQGVLVQPASTYRGWTYWVETIPGSGLYAGFYKLGDTQSKRLGHDQTSVVMAGMILRDAIDEVASEPPSLSAKTGQWAADYVVYFPAMSYKK